MATHCNGNGNSSACVRIAETVWGIKLDLNMIPPLLDPCQCTAMCCPGTCTRQRRARYGMYLQVGGGRKGSGMDLPRCTDSLSLINLNQISCWSYSNTSYLMSRNNSGDTMTRMEYIVQIMHNSATFCSSLARRYSCPVTVWTNDLFFFAHLYWLNLIRYNFDRCKKNKPISVAICTKCSGANSVIESGSAGFVGSPAPAQI